MTDLSNVPSCFTLHGFPASAGRVHGPAYRWERVTAYEAPAPGDADIALQAAFSAAHARLNQAIATADATLRPLLEAQQLMLDDPDLRDGAMLAVAGGCAPTTAVIAVATQLAATLEALDSSYFRERAIDVRAVGALVVATLTGAEVREIPVGAVVIAEELSPLDTAQLAAAGASALVTVHGGPTCHAAIIARAWGIPAVVGAPEAALSISDGTPVLIDGRSAEIIVHPTPEQIDSGYISEPTIHLTRRVPVCANIGSLGEAARAVALGAEGIGLLRTEFLFHARRTPPSEEEQLELYSDILRCLDGRPVVIRTLDIGADKLVPFLPLPPEANPQLGVRGIRLCLQHLDIFRTQLRALVRAAAAGPLKILIPMVTMAEEMWQVRDLLTEITTELGLPFPELGAMIEVPMAALAAPELAVACDFFSLGTNDLLQFLLAADRQHAGVGYLHVADPTPVWRLIGPVIEAAHAANIPVSVCGEWGADPGKLPHLLAFGIDAVSVSVAALGRVRAMMPA